MDQTAGSQVQTSPNLNTANQNSSTSGRSFKKVLFILLLIIFTTIAAYLLYSFVAKQQLLSPRATKENIKEDAFFNINDPNISEYGEYYGFTTKITGFDEQAREVFTEMKGPNVPKIIIGPKTLVLYLRPDNITRTTSPVDLDVGQDVYFIMSYNKKTRTWVTRNASILVDKFPEKTATTSATRN